MDWGWMPLRRAAMATTSTCLIPLWFLGTLKLTDLLIIYQNCFERVVKHSVHWPRAKGVWFFLDGVLGARLTLSYIKHKLIV